MEFQVRSGNLQVDQALQAKLREITNSPQGKRAVARLVNKEGAVVRDICEEIAKEDLHQRSDPSRRSPESIAHGKRLHESFEVVPARENDYKLVVKVRNTHPAFPFVEKGTQPHRIQARDADKLIFPFDGAVGRGRKGAKGSFAIDWGDAPRFVGPVVDHPGTIGRDILGRAIRRYRRRAQRHRVS